KKYYQAIFGVEKEYRLSKVAKISAFMYGQDEINVIYCDALDTIQQEISGKIVLVDEETIDILVANPPFAVDGFLTTLSKSQREHYTLFNDAMDAKKQSNIQCFFIERAKQLLAPKGIAAIIVPSSVLSNSDATHIGSREILLKHFDIVALVELGSGTFGKTGTNTVILFLRRKHQQPPESEQYFNRVTDWFNPIKAGDDVYNDRHFIERYCGHINIPFEQYETLLNGEPSAALLAHELFVDYQNNFDKSSDIRNLATQKFFKAYSAEHQQAELNKRFLAYLHGIEQDKLYYFVLAYTNPQKVLVILAEIDGICSTDILVFRFENQELAKFYAYYFLSKPFNDEVLRGVSGQQLPRTSWNYMQAIKIPVPDLKIQQTLVTQIAAFEQQIAAAQKIIAGAASRKQAVLKHYL
ncbi:MAG: N-6 DNA methylase, partial [Methylovulum sp.]|nr:N-6 DNA methylase [Methylovulum sp.]